MRFITLTQLLKQGSDHVTSERIGRLEILNRGQGQWSISGPAPEVDECLATLRASGEFLAEPSLLSAPLRSDVSCYRVVRNWDRSLATREARFQPSTLR